MSPCLNQLSVQIPKTVPANRTRARAHARPDLGRSVSICHPGVGSSRIFYHIFPDFSRRAQCLSMSLSVSREIKIVIGEPR